MPLKRCLKSLAGSLGVVFVTTLLATCATAANSAPVRIAYSSISGSMLPLWVAQDQRLFEKYGVNVELTYIRGIAIEAMLAGEAQLVRASPPAVVRATLRGADLVISPNTINVAVFSLMSRPEIKQP